MNYFFLFCIMCVCETGVEFRKISKMDRQDYLESQYCFTCNCKACTTSEYENFMVNYASFLHVYSKFYITLIYIKIEIVIFLKKKFTAIKCPECSGPLLLCDDHDPPMFCSDCGATVFEFTYIYKIRQAQLHANTYFNEAETNIRNENLIQAVAELKKCLSLRKKILYKYHEDIIATLDLMAQLCVRMGLYE